eukprot:3428515-Rhodomonas_salina.1
MITSPQSESRQLGEWVGRYQMCILAAGNGERVTLHSNDGSIGTAESESIGTNELRTTECSSAPYHVILTYIARSGH